MWTEKLWKLRLVGTRAVCMPNATLGFERSKQSNTINKAGAEGGTSENSNVFKELSISRRRPCAPIEAQRWNTETSSLDLATRNSLVILMNY